MKTKFTKGEWKAEGYSVTGKGVGIIARCIIPEDGNCTTAIENAKLIAAAPELLKAVIKLQGRLDMLILSTATGKFRERLTDENMKAMGLIDEFTQ